VFSLDVIERGLHVLPADKPIVFSAAREIQHHFSNASITSRHRRLAFGSCRQHASDNKQASSPETFGVGR
jgi:hypothetical protein